MSVATAPTGTAALTADTVKVRDFPAYAATLFADPGARRALLALHAFADEVAAVRDHVTQPLPGEIRLQWWVDALTGEGHGGVEGHPVAAELKRAMAAFDLPTGDVTRFIDAWRADLYAEPVPDLTALEAFLTDTSSTLIGLAARICSPGAAVPPDIIRHAGLALGLVRLIGQLPRDASRGRLYLPRDLLALNGVAPEEILAGQTPPGLWAILAYLAREAEQHLAVVAAPDTLRPALLPLALARRTLKQLHRAEYDPRRLEPASRLAVLWTYWRAGRSGKF